MRLSDSSYKEDYSDVAADAAGRVGAKIRKIRTARGLSQGELGERVGLNADRIQKYENGVRKPKQELLKKIADALDVETLALTDPIVASSIGSMYAFFDMEDYYHLQVEEIDGDLYLSFPGREQNSMNVYLRDWHNEIVRRDRQLKMVDSEKEKEEVMDAYNNWKWNYPKPSDYENNIDALKSRLKSRIQVLENLLSEMEK